MAVGTKSVRWAFKCGSWKPTKEQFMLAARCMQTEEKERIGKFVFQKDAKSSLSGRLLMRKVINDELRIPYNQIKLKRTEKGKPFLANQIPKDTASFNFNVSHQGDYAVLAAEPKFQVGVDVMQIEIPRGDKTVAKFFDTMSRQFTKQEWTHIKKPKDDWSKMREFYRIWCLKESYVKTFGIGIGFELHRIDFHVHSPINREDFVTDTQVYVDGVLDGEWKFEEIMLDDKHCVAVATHTRHEKDAKEMMTAKQPEKFKLLDFEELTSKSVPILDKDEKYWDSFDKKDEAPGRKS